MKKFCALSLMVLSAIFLAPQAEAAIFGVKAGLNFANMNIKPVEPDMPDFKNLTGPAGGIFFSFGIGPLSIQPEVLYSRRGMMYEDSFELETYKMELFLDYIEVPLLVKFSFIPVGPIKPVIFAGPSFGYLVKAKGKYTESGTSVTEDLKDEFKSTETAAVFGVGVDFKLPVIKLTVDARYHLGISNIAEETYWEGTAKNKGFSVMVGVGF